MPAWNNSTACLHETLLKYNVVSICQLNRLCHKDQCFSNYNKVWTLYSPSLNIFQTCNRKCTYILHLQVSRKSEQQYDIQEQSCWISHTYLGTTTRRTSCQHSEASVPRSLTFLDDYHKCHVNNCIEPERSNKLERNHVAFPLSIPFLEYTCRTWRNQYLEIE